MQKRVDLLICGQQDAAIVFGFKGEPGDVLLALRDRFGDKRASMTVGEAGAIGLEGETIHPADGYPVELVDRIGAGDVVAAGVICGLLENDFTHGLRYRVARSALQLTLSGDHFRPVRPDVPRLMERGVARLPLR